MRTVLDDLDQRILATLHRNGRESIVDIAKQLNVPRSTIMERIARLRQTGVIRGFTVRVDPRAMGRGQAAIVMIQAKSTPQTESLASRLAQLPGVEEAHIVTGEWDIVLKLRGEDLPALYEVHRRIVALESVGRVATFPCSKTVLEP